MKYLSKENITNKTVLLRCDFNVPVENNLIIDDSKIQKSLKTIKYLLDNNNRVITLSHFGRVKEEVDKKNNSLHKVYLYLKKYLDIVFIENNLNVEFYLKTSKSNCFLLENTRFTDIPRKRESANDLELAKYWASFGDVFVIDAFASLHRLHSSVAGISNYLPTYYGFLVEEEITNLNVLQNASSPFIVIMGGKKIDDKINIINTLVKKCDYLILTGGILNTFLKVMGKNVGKSLVSNNEEILSNVKNIIKEYSDKILYTDNFTVLNNGKNLKRRINEVEDEDIIYDNVVNSEDYLRKAKVVFFNGTCGKVEEDAYSIGTRHLLDTLSKIDAKVIVGGGDTVGYVNKINYADKFYYLSSGGGATLEYVATGSLKAIDYIEDVKNN